MTESVMNQQIERRKSPRDATDELSPECLALLVSCGGEVRASDRELLERLPAHELSDRRLSDRRMRGAAARTIKPADSGEP